MLLETLESDLGDIAYYAYRLKEKDAGAIKHATEREIEKLSKGYKQQGILSLARPTFEPTFQQYEFVNFKDNWHER